MNGRNALNRGICIVVHAKFGQVFKFSKLWYRCIGKWLGAMAIPCRICNADILPRKKVWNQVFDRVITCFKLLFIIFELIKRKFNRAQIVMTIHWIMKVKLLLSLRLLSNTRIKTKYYNCTLQGRTPNHIQHPSM